MYIYLPIINLTTTVHSLLRYIIINNIIVSTRNQNLIRRSFQVRMPENHSDCEYNQKDTTKNMSNYLPIFASGEIVRGFGRGSKELGVPTANYPLEVVKSIPEALETGIYYGWANVDNGEVLKMVLSLGWNPFYNNTEKSVETHILHDFNCDLYGRFLKICIVGYLRPERNFDSLDDLIKAIKSDIETAKQCLDKDSKNLELKQVPFFKEPIKRSPDN